MRPDVEKLCLSLNYQFNQAALLNLALTHRSAATSHNERLEFLGDSVLSLVIAEAIYQRYHNQAEGVLSRLRSYLVKGDTLAEIAREIKLGDYLIMGQGELRSGGFRRASILADALEAVFAAIYLDGGFEACKKSILFLFESRLNDGSLINDIKDAKSVLQEKLQSQGMDLPDYQLVKTVGEEHAQQFYVQCQLKSLQLSTEGVGPSRRKAEQKAAKAMLALIGK
ncbi:ribonuclease III [Legionella sp. W05-934-2]|uniref:ribonuclease III n=1 Tax=Legionella sp. W05-934-2 TaxID=1198649 RepID=UPI003461A4D3